MSNLPSIDFAVKDAATIENEIINTYQTISGRTLAEGDPVKLFLKAITTYVVQQRQVIDFTGKQNLLSYASGNNLEHVGALLNVTRNPAIAAITTIRFTLSAAQLSAVTIPQGTRVTKDSVIFFETIEIAEIAAGNMFIDVQVVSQTAGDVANGIIPGELNILVDPIPFVATVVNTVITAGGIDEESDESFRLRIQQAPEIFSNAGSSGAYEYWTRTYSQSVIDVSVYSPSPGFVNVLPLMTDGAMPTSAELTAISELLTDDKVRPLTDNVSVIAPTQVNYGIDLTYYIRISDGLSAVTIQTKVNQAIQEYILWQRTKIGRDINDDELSCRIIQAGAKRVVINSPVFTSLSNTQVANNTSLNVVYGGLEND